MRNYRGGRGGNEVCMYSGRTRSNPWPRGTKGRDENIVQCSGEKGSSCAIVCWSGDCFFVGQVEGQVKTKV